MNGYSVDKIRTMFLEFFQNKDHLILPSASLIPHGDPSLLLTVAGMVPFKRQFLGLEKPIHPRIATSQKCIRTGDIENVGETERHNTFFEMLGNFSFGDYFKKEIIPWSWEFVVEHLGLPQDQLWVSVYLDDDEAEEIWRTAVGLPKERIVRLGKEDNFWETGSGPCGPCSEIYIDRGPEHGCGRPDCKPGCDCERFWEFWNLVFIQFHQEGETYTPLKAKSIDTGMGLERVAAILQGKDNVFEVDSILPILAEAARIAGLSYGQNGAKDRSLRVIADHLRAVAYLVSDGVLPTNEGRGYVLRRLLRRAVRHGRMLGITEPFSTSVVDKVIEQGKQAYPELIERREFIHRVLDLEEKRFGETLDQGMRLLQELVEKAEKAGAAQIGGKEVFQLYDTFGFPPELTREILAEHKLVVDEKGFSESMEAQRKRARQSRTATGYLDPSLAVYQDLAGTLSVEFVGYDQPVQDARLMAIIVHGRQVDQVQKGDKAVLILDRTPFYAESGGQVADQGCIEAETGKIRVEHVQRPLEGLVSHLGVVETGTLAVGSRVKAYINEEMRNSIARHHTATHLLHSALKAILGDHVNQAGSYVGSDRLRFDFTHFQALSWEEREEVEDRVNGAILRNEPVEAAHTDLETARKQGAIALFGEKYDFQVRTVKVGEDSLELCGGTHVRATGEIGLFKILAEGSVAAGVRRIEAVVGLKALDHLREQEAILQNIEASLPGKMEELPGRVASLLEKNQALERELTGLKQKNVLEDVDKLISRAEKIGDIALLEVEVEVAKAEDLRLLGDRLRDKLAPAAILLGTRQNGKVLLLAMVSKSLAERGLHAGKAVQGAAKICGGGGGGRADMAQAGGKKPEKLGEALAAGAGIFRKQMEEINLQSRNI